MVIGYSYFRLNICLLSPAPELCVESPILNVLTFGDGIPTFRRQLGLNEVMGWGGGWI